MPRILHVLHRDDNVATALAEVAAGTEVSVERQGAWHTVRVLQPIPLGHKIALEPICRGLPVRKYGEVIGLASADIAAGEHVHVHNVESQRGRGDLRAKDEGR